MPSETSRRPQTAGSFVTLSLPRSNATNPAKGPGQESVIDDQSPSTPIKLDKKQGLGLRSLNSTPKSKHRVPVKASTPLRGQSVSSQPTSLTSTPVNSRILTLKYKVSSKIQENASINGASPPKSGDRKPRKSTIYTPKEKRSSLDSQPERRSSTASLTDTGTRSSGRARKLTTKAQALAGTNFLPSLRTSLDLENASDRDSDAEGQIIKQKIDENEETNRDASELTVADQTQIEAQKEVAGEVSELIVLEIPNDAIDQAAETPANDVLLDAVTEAPVESVEPVAVRVSTRERKPTARASELETVRTSRKRPSSPLFIDRVSKLARQSPSVSGRPSRLRHSSVNTENASIPETVMQVTESRDISDVDDNTRINGLCHGSSKAALEQEVADLQRSDASPASPATHQDSLPQVESKNAMVPCDLSCLSPSARLFAFAKLASEWPDDDDDDDDEEENSDENDIDLDFELATTSSDEGVSILEKVRQLYCQCQRKSVNSNILLKEDGTSAHPVVIQDHSPVAPQHLPLNGNSVNTAAIPNPSRTKEDGMLQSTQPVEQISTNRKSLPLQLSIKRPSSSFERRMQADYLASSPKKKQKTTRATRMSNISHNSSFHAAPLSGTTSPSRSLRTRDSNTPVANEANRRPVSLETLSKPSVCDGSSAKAQPDGEHIAARVHNLTKSTKPFQMSQSAVLTSTVTKPSVEATTQKALNKSVAQKSKVAMRGGGKSPTNGPVRLSLLEGPGKEAGHSTIQYPRIAPPQAKSIKLRFTTGLK